MNSSMNAFKKSVQTLGVFKIFETVIDMSEEMNEEIL